MFPEIHTIDDVLPHIQGKDEIAVIKKDGYTVIDYNYVAPTTFDNPYAAECRGLKFYPTGQIMSRPFHKFFNVGEKPETQLGELPWDDKHTIMDKLDGSMIHPAYLDGELVLMTRKGYTDVAKQAMEEALNDDIAWQMMGFLEMGITPIYEFTSPNNRVVVEYDTPRLTLLAARKNVTGKYFTSTSDKSINWSDANGRTNDPSVLMETVRSLPGNREGIVVAWDSGLMVKIKGDEYVRLHRVIDVMAHEKRILEVLLHGNQDDLIPMLAEDRVEKLQKYNESLNRSIDKYTQLIYDFVLKRKDLTQKDFALQVQEEFDGVVRGMAFRARKQNMDKQQLRAAIVDMMITKCTSQTNVDAHRDFIGTTWKVERQLT